MIKLKPNDKVAVVAPSAQIGSIEKIEKGLAYLHNIGLKPVIGKHTLSQNRYMAGTDKQRADDINAAFTDSDIKAIFCVRAAAGASRILPYIDYELALNNLKPVIGFCDNAALQIALNKYSQIVSLNGFSLTYDFKNSALDSQIKSDLENLLFGKKIPIQSGKLLKSGTAEGKLICTNLSTLTYLCGTPYFPNLSDSILLLEDVHEKLHKIDLMLQQLKQQPNFDKLQGIIFGQFTDCTADSEDGTLSDCFNDFLYKTDLPAIYDFNFGHTSSRRVLPLGAKVKFSADNALLEIL